MVKTLPTPPQNEGTIRTKKDMKEEKKREHVEVWDKVWIPNLFQV